MDPITHGLLGGVASQAFFTRPLGRWAGVVGLLAAWLPDLDVLIVKPSDPVFSFVVHRGFTHSLLFLPVGALLVALLFWWTRWGRDKRLALFLAALVGITTHGLCDAVTSYGTMLYWPFTDYRVAWDVMPIIDLFVWSVLVVGFALGVILRTRWVGVATLAILLGYTGVGVVQNQRASGALRLLAQARGHDPVNLRVMPAPGTMVLWRGIYLHEGEIHVDGIRTPYFAPVLASPGESIPLATAEDVLHTSADTDEIRRVFEVFSWFSDGYVAVVAHDPIVVSDIRYGGAVDGISPMWGIAYRGDGPARWSGMRGGEGEGGRGGYARELWTLLREGDPRFARVDEVVERALAEWTATPKDRNGGEEGDDSVPFLPAGE